MEGHNGHGGVFKYLREGQNFVCPSFYYFLSFLCDGRNLADRL